MLEKVIVTIVFLSLVSAGFAQNQDSKIYRYWKAYSLADTVMYFRGYSRFLSRFNEKIFFFNMHDNEDTCVLAGEDFIKNNGGYMLDLRHYKTNSFGERRFRFTNEEMEYSFDPNRIFSKEGIVLTFKEMGGPSSEEAVAIVEQFVEQTLAYKKGRLFMVALHNIVDKRTFSLSNYLWLKKGSDEVKDVYYGKKPYTQFFYVTEEFLFNEIKNMGYNVVLQGTNPYDNGALSIYAARKGIPYINIECLTNHLSAQIDMLNVAFKAMYQYYPYYYKRKEMKSIPKSYYQEPVLP